MSKIATWHWHIEVSSKCTLRCPRCPRQESPDTLVNAELSLEFFKRNFTPEFIIGNVEKISFCGNDGDPIYAHELIEIIQYFKSIKPVEFVIITNGSYKKAEWWQHLGAVLTDIDEVHFSIDGWDQLSNEKYRVNCDWDSIITGMTTLRKSSPVFITWAAIAFAFNEHNLKYMQLLATDYGCDQFQLTKSTKFNKVYSSYPPNDTLQPIQESMISSIGRFERVITPITSRVKKNASLVTNTAKFEKVVQFYKDKSIVPLCEIGTKGLYLSSTGKLYPCCWTATRYSHNHEWDELCGDLKKSSISEVLSSDSWVNELKTFRWQECKDKCNSKVTNFSYCTEW